MRVPTLVLRRFVINSANNGLPCVEIVGRPSGLVAWLLTVMKLSAETTLIVTDLNLIVKSASLSGDYTNFVPLPHVSSTHCGYSKPIGYLISAASFAFFGIVGGLTQRDGTGELVIGLLVAAAFIVAYLLSRKLRLEILTDSGLPLKLTFKPSMIEGVPVNIAAVTEALQLLNSKVLAAA